MATVSGWVCKVCLAHNNVGNLKCEKCSSSPGLSPMVKTVTEGAQATVTAPTFLVPSSGLPKEHGSENEGTVIRQTWVPGFGVESAAASVSATGVGSPKPKLKAVRRKNKKAAEDKHIKPGLQLTNPGGSSQADVVLLMEEKPRVKRPRRDVSEQIQVNIGTVLPRNTSTRPQQPVDFSMGMEVTRREREDMKAKLEEKDKQIEEYRRKLNTSKIEISNLKSKCETQTKELHRLRNEHKTYRKSRVKVKYGNVQVEEEWTDRYQSASETETTQQNLCIVL